MNINTKIHVSVRPLGQAGFSLKAEGICVLVDPYLTYSVDDGDRWIRKYAPPVIPEKMTGVDYVFMSHDHLDHVDPETVLGISKASPKCKFAASAWYAVKRLSEIGIPEDRIISLEEGELLKLSDTVTVTPIPAAHEELHPCIPGGFEEMGFIFDFNGTRVYHGGDTCLYDGLADRINGVDIGIIPVNGRDEARHAMNCIGNMNAAEAAWLANEANIGCTIPCHWELYELNGETPENIHTAFAKYPNVRYILMTTESVEI